MSWLRSLCCALAIAAGSWLVGWWMIPLIAFVYGLVRARSAAPTEAAFAAGIAWLLLLLQWTLRPGANVLLNRIGRIFPVPGIVVLGVAVLFATLLGWSAARVAIGFRRLPASPRG